MKNNSENSERVSPLKPKRGVYPNSHWLPKGSWVYYLDYLTETFPHISKKEWQRRMSRKEVVTSEGEAIEADSLFAGNKHIYFYRELENEELIPFNEEILFENDEIIIVDKPHFLPVAPVGNYLQETLVVRLRNQLKSDEIELCHRLDRETAGLVLVSKKKDNRALYHQLFSHKKIKKIYQAVALRSNKTFPIIHRSRIVSGDPYFRMQEIEGQANSETHIEKLAEKGDHALYQLTPLTGKKHQLRVHMAALGIPIHNDHFYPKLTLKPVEDYLSPLQLLAKSLQFIDPITGESHYFESRLNLDWPR